MGTKGIAGLLCAGAALLATCDAQGDQVPGNSSAAPPTLILRGGTVAAEVSIDAEFAESEEWADASPEFAEGVASSVAGQLRVDAGRVHVFDISETDQESGWMDLIRTEEERATFCVVIEPGEAGEATAAEAAIALATIVEAQNPVSIAGMVLESVLLSPGAACPLQARAEFEDEAEGVSGSIAITQVERGSVMVRYNLAGLHAGDNRWHVSPEPCEATGPEPVYSSLAILEGPSVDRSERRGDVTLLDDSVVGQSVRLYAGGLRKQEIACAPVAWALGGTEEGEGEGGAEEEGGEGEGGEEGAEEGGECGEAVEEEEPETCGPGATEGAEEEGGEEGRRALAEEGECEESAAVCVDGLCVVQTVWENGGQTSALIMSLVRMFYMCLGLALLCEEFFVESINIIVDKLVSCRCFLDVPLSPSR